MIAPYLPQQNRVVERRNMTLLEMTQSILKHMDVPNYLWGEAVRHATYLINSTAMRTLICRRHTRALRGRNLILDTLEYLDVLGT